MRHVAAERVVVSSRGLREGLALGDPSAAVPTPRQVRTISVATLAARFATWDVIAAGRRSSLAAQLIDALDPETTAFMAELLEHAAALLDVGKAIDHYERFEHAAMIVTTADLAGFSHEALGTLSAILRHAGGDTSLGPYARMIPAGDRPAVRRAAVALALAEELHRRIPAGEPASLTCTLAGPVRGRGPCAREMASAERRGSVPSRLRSEALRRPGAGRSAAQSGDGTRLGTRGRVGVPQDRDAAGSLTRNVVPRPSSLVDLDRASVVLDHVLHDREPESRAARLPGTSSVDPVEALEDPGDVSGRDPDALCR